MDSQEDESFVIFPKAEKIFVMTVTRITKDGTKETIRLPVDQYRKYFFDIEKDSRLDSIELEETNESTDLIIASNRF